jgi:signal transduction histidine kinase/CheY-like chemotaxis protein
MEKSLPKILIVDDKPQNLYTLAQLLDKLDVEIIEAGSGFDALDLALKHEFCMAIIDIQMPEMDGYELVELLRSNERTATLPIIFVSAIFSDEFYHVKGYEAGAVDFLSKPFNPEILLSKVKVFLQLYNQRIELEEKNKMLSKLALELETSSRVGRFANAILDMDELLPEVTFLILTMFKYYFVGVWLLNEESTALVLRSRESSDNRIDGPMSIKTGYELPVDTPVSIIVSSYQDGKVYVANDTENDPNYLALKELPETRSEIAFPLQMGGNVFGILDIQSDKKDAFDQDSQTALQMLANQVSIAIHNARLYHLEKDLRSLEAEKTRELIELNANKDRFFSIVAHDLRGPFTPLLGMSEMMVEMPDSLSTEDFREFTESIYRTVRDVYDLLENLLAWSRLQRGKMETEIEHLPLKQVIEKNIQLLSNIAASKGVHLENTVTADIFIDADKNMLNTVARNLISNALKFTPQGGKVSVSAQSSSKDTDMMQIAVTDTGIGITKDDQAKLFRMDVTHSTMGTAKEAGTGLGLIICQEMVEKMSGRIWVESEGIPGQGTTIQFTVPQTIES